MVTRVSIRRKVLLLGLAALGAQAQTKTQLELKLNTVVPQVLVNITLSTGADSLFLPYCGQEEGTPILCVQGVHLQVHSAHGFRPAKLRTTVAVLGGMELGRFDGGLLPARTDTRVVFFFSRRHFEVEPGQPLRLLVDLWSNETAMTSAQVPTQIASPPFEYPRDGFGW